VINLADHLDEMREVFNGKTAEELNALMRERGYNFVFENADKKDESMNNETNTPASYGEPWAIWDVTKSFIEDSSKNDVADFLHLPQSKERAARAVQCVNACQGIADPVEALNQVRDILRQIREAHSQQHTRLLIRDLTDIALAKLNAQ